MGCDEAKEPTQSANSTEMKKKNPVLIDGKSPLAKLACKANRNTVQNAVGVFLTQKKRMPEDIHELQAVGMFEKNMTCPSGGTYTIDERGVTTCSLHK